MTYYLGIIAIALLAGVSSGLFGVGGGIIIVPGLVFLVGFPIHKAVGTSLLAMLPPIGLLAVLEFYRFKNVDVRAAVIISVVMVLAAYFGASLANQFSSAWIKLWFGCYLVLIGLYLIISNYFDIN